MRTKPIATLNRYIVFIWVTAICLGLSFHFLLNAMPIETQDSDLSANVRPFYKSIKDIDLFFTGKKIPIETKEVSNNSTDFYFVTAHPYSGIDTTDLYCFVRRGNGWAMFIKAFLWETPFAKDIKFKPDGEFINVICKDRLILKLNPQK